MGDRLTALIEAKRAHGEVVNALFESRGTNRVQATEGEWDRMSVAGATEKAAREALIPTEQDAINLIHDCYVRLKDLGWNSPIYCPKDGSEFDAIEMGSTGIHKTHYSGEWPTGSWWVAEAGDIWPSRPCLYRRTEAENARWAEIGKGLRDSDTRPKDGDGTAPLAGSAGLQGIAKDISHDR